MESKWALVIFGISSAPRGIVSRVVTVRGYGGVFFDFSFHAGRALNAHAQGCEGRFILARLILVFNSRFLVREYSNRYEVRRSCIFLKFGGYPSWSSLFLGLR